jgi:dTDP-4-amino-4,6-dideoxygalactose transaminase
VAALSVLRSGRYVGGEEVESFEAEFAAFCGTKHGVAISNGTDALRLALLASGVGAGDEVVTSPFTFIGTTEAISQCGARFVLADIEADTFTLDPKAVERVLTPRTRAFLPIHLYGQCADMRALGAIAAPRRLAVVEDACQAHGATLDGRRAGAFGASGAFSFYPTKNLGGFGEGGFVTTDDAAIAARVRRLRDHGQSAKYLHAEEGYNGRLDALQCALLRVKLRRLEAWNARRRGIATRYRQALAPLETRGLLRLPVERAGGAAVYHQFAVRVLSDRGSGRDAVRARLREAGVETGVHYPVPLHLQPCYAGLNLGSGSFPESERAAREVLTLPIYPQLDDARIDRVAAALDSALGRA